MSPPPNERRYYTHHAAVQNDNSNNNGEPYPVGGEDELLVILKLYSVSAIGPGMSNDEIRIERYVEVSRRYIWVGFSGIKQQQANHNHNNNWSESELMANSLSDMGVPVAEHPFCIDKLFDAVQVAVSPHRPIILGVWHVTISNESEPVLIPASESAIEGLEIVRLDCEIIGHTPSCAICLKDFAQQEEEEGMVTRMPCSHYHGDCIVEWLHINHLCPMCRYPMPSSSN